MPSQCNSPVDYDWEVFQKKYVFKGVLNLIGINKEKGFTK